MKTLLITALALLAALATPQAPAQTSASSPPPSPTQRLRATVQSFDGSTLVLKERSGEVLSLALADNFSVNEVLPVELSAIQPGSFVGVATQPQTDGSLQAIEVLVFPEAARGTGEGHYPWDLQPGSMMTNATVGDIASTPQGRTLKLHYKGGEQTIQVPTGTPIVTFKPADRALLVPGAKVMVTAQVRDGKPTALRALAGRNGFTPPM